jgi:hypothetical protein
VDARYGGKPLRTCRSKDARARRSLAIRRAALRWRRQIAATARKAGLHNACRQTMYAASRRRRAHVRMRSRAASARRQPDAQRFAAAADSKSSDADAAQ